MVEILNDPHKADPWFDAALGKPVDLREALKGYKAQVDWPGCHFWRELIEAFPDAKVVLSLRDPEAWYTSISNTIFKALQMPPPDDPVRAKQGQMAREIVLHQTFDGRVEDKDHCIAVYNAHNEAVKAEVPADKLLVYEVGSGWEPLCDFLGVPVPEEDYPRTNSTEEFANLLKD